MLVKYCTNQLENEAGIVYLYPNCLSGCMCACVSFV